MTEALVCWNCGASIEELPLPLSRYAECLSCRTALHVCRMCRHYDPGVARQCREPIAEEVQDKERPNVCELFQDRRGAWRPVEDAPARQARAQLDALFGDSGQAESAADEPDRAREDAERLFRSDQ